MDRRTFIASLGAAALAAGRLDGIEPQKPPESKKQSPDYASTGVKLLTGTPRRDGYRLPAEWERHERTVMAFPTAANWRRGRLEAARAEWVTVARAVRRFEPVLMLAHTGDGKRAAKLCGSKIDVVEMPLDSAWTRDTGPLVLTAVEKKRSKTAKRRAAGFTFNAWGGKYPNVARDAVLKARLCKHLDFGLYPAPLTLEGGALTVDGEGTLIATERSILNPNRNPGVSRSKVEKVLGDYLSVRKCIWLRDGLRPDPITDGHVDGICAFVRPGVVMVHTTDDPEDPNFEICREARSRLRSAKDARGRKLEVIELPLLGEEIAHMNFYICNGGVIVPVAGESAQDDRPLAVIRKAFPDRTVVGVTGRVIAEGGGGVHCITQQIPA